MTRYMRKKVIETLESAHSLIERGWCRNHEAKNASGEACNPRSHHAVRWCLRGACAASTTRREKETEEAAVEELERTLFGDDEGVGRGDRGIGRPVAFYNDNIASDKRAALRVIRRTIKRLQRQEKAVGDLNRALRGSAQ